ncbi:hypothetical protein [Pseudalkalibacillus salsuginis]|uniref:UPF0738 family protein n=1 Tax=Pseudalkalibacillus salsuginis TaxID=2910972 RepID=UPI001F1C1D78|nr:hypothetical protein [Pseudalkalibacillus salsuginis]MCF6409183.1 hypothetical protein [Pseudalkalibacillus salsuginis]
MTIRLEVTSSEIFEDKVEFACNSENIAGEVALEPSEQVLVDSDSLSFIYILETPDSFIYVSFPKERWTGLKAVITDEKDAILKLSNHEPIHLKGIKGEMGYLIQNISGNANYGNEMMSSVEEIFQPING